MARKAPTRVLEYTVHSAVANPPSGTDMLQRLTHEHRAFRTLWEDMQRAHIRERGEGHAVDNSRLGETSQADLAPQIVQLLADHEDLELEVLYPVAAKVMNDDWAAHARAEHAEMRDQLRAIELEDPADEGVFEIFSAALTRIVAHMDEEDTVLFPILRMELSPAELMIDRPFPTGLSSTGIRALPPAPKVVDIAAAEREAAQESTSHGGTGRSRRLLRRR